MIENVIDDIKIFIHTWKINDREDFIKTIYDVKNKESDKTVETDLSFLENYNYESLLIENYDYKKEYFKKIFDSLEFSEYLREDYGPISMHYSIYRSNELKKRYEEIHNMTFDRVIRMRFDSNFLDGELDLDQLYCDVCIPFGDDWVDGLKIGRAHV